MNQAPIPNRAFTLIELLIVVAISTMLSALAITYSSVGRNAVALSIEEAKLSQFILQAKALSVATYTSGSASCGYGVVINASASPQQYSIFAYSPSGGCPNVGSITSIDASQEAEYTEGTWQIPVTNGVKINTSNDLVILFYPPDPVVFLSDDGSRFRAGSLTIPLATVDNKNSATISINPEGQVNFP